MEVPPKTPCPGLQPLLSGGLDMVAYRPSRRPITGVAYNAQRSRLVPDAPDAEGNANYPCKIANVSDGGFGVVCRAAEKSPDLFQTDALMMLESGDGTRIRVQIQWVSHGRIGLKRFGSKSR